MKSKFEFSDTSIRDGDGQKLITKVSNVECANGKHEIRSDEKNVEIRRLESENVSKINKKCFAR